MAELELSPLQKGKHALGQHAIANQGFALCQRIDTGQREGDATRRPCQVGSIRLGLASRAPQRQALQSVEAQDVLPAQPGRRPCAEPGSLRAVAQAARYHPRLEGDRWTTTDRRRAADALSSSDLLLYFGHGGAEQFIRQSKVRELQRCAVAMLWGCSSAMLHDNGEFDRTGTPLNYMCAGTPAMVGNLWDMTDRELDSVCEGVFGRLGLMEAKERAEVKPAARNIKLDRKGNLEASRGPTEMSLARAVAESRNDCRLPYLTEQLRSFTAYRLLERWRSVARFAAATLALAFILFANKQFIEAMEILRRVLACTFDASSFVEVDIRSRSLRRRPVKE